MNIARLNTEAAILIRQGKYDQAEADLRESLKRKPDQPGVHMLLNKIATLREDNL
jgi:Flp pilus assembly protein TadD